MDEDDSTPHASLDTTPAELRVEPCVQLGDQVIIYQSRDSIVSLIVTAGAQLQCRFGVFKHEAMVGVLFGSKVSNLVPPRCLRAVRKLILSQPARVGERKGIRLPASTDSGTLVNQFQRLLQGR